MEREGEDDLDSPAEGPLHQRCCDDRAYHGAAIGQPKGPGLALELPGKLRLRREEYLTVRPIYYPGFTVRGGVGEVGGLLATLALLRLTPRATPAFWLTFGAFVALLATHLLYWTLTHPVNNFWLAGFELKGLSAGFFGVGSKRAATSRELD